MRFARPMPTDTPLKQPSSLSAEHLDLEIRRSEAHLKRLMQSMDADTLARAQNLFDAKLARAHAAKRVSR